MDVLTRLSHEHADLRTYIERIASAAEARDAATLAASLEAAHAALTIELDSHITVEETEAFTGIREELGEGLVAPFYEEHTEIRALRDDVFARMARGEAPYGLCLNLCELILAHQQREDLMLFPSAREAAAGRRSP